MRKIEKPKDGEFPQYAIMYIKLMADDGLLLKHLKENLAGATYSVIAAFGLQSSIVFMILPIIFLFFSYYLWRKKTNDVA